MLELRRVIMIWIVAQEDVTGQEPGNTEELLLLEDLAHLLGVAHFGIGTDQVIQLEGSTDLFLELIVQGARSTLLEGHEELPEICLVVVLLLVCLATLVCVEVRREVKSDSSIQTCFGITIVTALFHY